MEDIFINISKDYWLQSFFKDKDLITLEDLFNLIENLDGQVMELKEKVQDLETDIKEHYKSIPFDPYEEYGISEKDFH